MKSHFDVLIIGAGLSGIGMACHMKRESPGRRVAILERRQAIGGTWDLFRYPGIRSDSDMVTYGYSFRPWNQHKTLADGPAIRQYIEDAAREHGVDRLIRFGTMIEGANWSSEHRCWTISAHDVASGEKLSFTCKQLVSCTGYYNHDQGYLPTFPGEENFAGLRIHPQHWPENLDYRNKRIVVIGSGATAVTLIPAMAETAQHITMLQRSPSYVMSVPGYDIAAAVLSRILPLSWVYSMARWRNLRLQQLIFKAARRWPVKVRSWLLNHVEKQVGKDVDMRHFTPKYNPWDERLCAVPDGDLFRVLREGKASVVTDKIKTFTEKGILLESGKLLEADIIITATGLVLQSLGGMNVSVDGTKVEPGKLLTYKGVLLENVPNFAYLFGYTNAPWTVKIEMSANYLCRLWEHMENLGKDVVIPRAPVGQKLEESVLSSIHAGYVTRRQEILPRQGRSLPWRVVNNLKSDRNMFLNDPVGDASLELTGPSKAKVESINRRAA
ncbi:FAD-dependent oxidoreductase [Pseudoduganella sp. FT93W]|uniref:FAD-dependent oxidoreductase n=1 Tax=Duganella fentianensis TaxID=2692177 RepID=A0A845HYD4_9BURK|nr:NAD(P)/FAD-dependent oxidoreductase [Duganella fentianensis]MYN44757.1 FAD-dependent oxidoreductase [Duganella fentianensis]